VGGINEIYKESTIKELFSKYGEVTYVNLNAAKKFAFVGFNGDDSLRDKIISSDIRFPDNKKLVIQPRKALDTKEPKSPKPASVVNQTSEASSSSTSGPRVVFSAQPLPSPAKTNAASIFEIVANADRFSRCPSCSDYFIDSYILPWCVRGPHPACQLQKCSSLQSFLYCSAHSICGACFHSVAENVKLMCQVCQVRLLRWIYLRKRC
jgi:hypothetical protein